MTGSNRRPPPCKGDALPTELITHILHFQVLLLRASFTNEWWVMTGSNRRPPPCKGDALPTELITPAVWSRIIGIREHESTLFMRKMFVRVKNSHIVLILVKNRRLPHKIIAILRWDRGNGVEDSPVDGRIPLTKTRVATIVLTLFKASA